jgi:rhamnosyltransferase
MSDEAPIVGVVIRTLNESELIGRCLETLAGQNSSYELDIVVVDSGSTDRTVEIARSHGARIVDIDPADFDYSKALNVGIEATRGELVISLSAHAIPTDDAWVAGMTAPFEDPKVAGVACRQVPWEDATWLEVDRIGRTFGREPLVYSGTAPDGILFSNAASAFRRSVWREHAFTLPAAEDIEWARRVVAEGWTVRYEPGPVVYHSHNESPRARALRLIDVNRVHHPGDPPRTWRRTLREPLGLVRRDARTVLGLDQPVTRKLRYLGDVLTTAFFYVLDFSRAGSTAERRRG